MPEIMSAEEFACELNAQRNYRIVHGIGKESREVGVYDPQYDTELIHSRDSAMLEKYKKAICNIFCSEPYCTRRQVCGYMGALDSAFAEIEGGK